MYRGLLLLCIVLWGSSLFAQRLKKEYVDPFNGNKIKETSEHTMYGTSLLSNLQYSAIRVNDDIGLKIRLTMGNSFYITMQDKFLLLLENGDVITFHPNEDGVSEWVIVEGITLWYLTTIYYPDNPEDLFKLIQFKVVRGRLHYEDSRYIYENKVRSNRAKILQRAIQWVIR